jgi:uncharacterized protein YndB with AHSA1/START domain
MKTMIQDTIQRELVLRAPKERVFQAIANPMLIVNWFPDKVEGTMSKGERSVFDFTDFGKVAIHVVASDPHDYFAYRWVPSIGASEDDPLKQPNTLVEFRLEEVSYGTRLTLTESGFASLPAEVIEKSLSDNNEGWDIMMGRLEKYMAA